MDRTHIKTLLETTRVIAIVGASAKPERASFGVARYLQEHGYRVIPVNPQYAGTQILGETVHATLTDAAAALKAEGQQIDMVDCFRRSEDILPIAQEAIAIGARSLWMQLDIINEEAAARARAAGLDVVMDLCTKIEHAELLA